MGKNFRLNKMRKYYLKNGFKGLVAVIKSKRLIKLK